MVALHGFTQTGGCLGPLVGALSESHAVVHPDLPGHGDASALAELDLHRIASHLSSAIGPTLDAPAVWLGYSLGGRIALHVALEHPEVVSGLVLIGATAGIDDDEERNVRAVEDRRLAQRLLDIGVDRFLQEWLEGPLFVGLPSWARFDEERRRNSAVGLAGSLIHAGTGAMDPLWGQLAAIDVPVLCIAGGEDAKFTSIGHRLVDELAHGRLEVIEGAGHAAHLERPAEVISAVLPLCDDLAPRGAARRHGSGRRWYADAEPSPGVQEPTRQPMAKSNP